jgi:hypothetical protein
VTPPQAFNFVAGGEAVVFGLVVGFGGESALFYVTAASGIK